MESLLTVAIIFLTVVQLTLGLGFMFVLARALGIDLTVFSFRKQDNNVNEDKSVPLVNFKPDFTKPIKVEYTDERNEVTPL